MLLASVGTTIVGRSIAGDLREEYVEHIHSRGRRRAALWYWLRVFALLVGDRFHRISALLRRPTFRDSGHPLQELTNMESVLKDVTYAVRALARQPAFTLVAVLSLAIGLGVNTAIFSLANAVLLRPLPGVTEPGTLLEVGRSQNGQGSDTFGYPSMQSLRETSRTTELAAWTLAPLAIGGGDAADAVLGAQVGENYFAVLGVTMQLGRGFAVDEGPGSGASVAVISDALWERRYQRDPDIVGQTVIINGVPATVTGVTEPGFSGTYSFMVFDAWVPIGMQASGLITDARLESWSNNFLFGVGRLRDGATLETATAELPGLMAALVQEHPDDLAGQGVTVAVLGTIPVFMRTGLQLFMLALMIAVGLGLMVACVNVAGMLVARALSRGREIAVRQAIGASRVRLARQLLTESTVLFLVGGGLGVVLSVWAMRLLQSFNPPLPPPLEIIVTPSLDARVLGFSLAITLLTALLFGFGPALRGSRPDLVPALKDDSHSAPAGRSRIRGLLIALQVAITVVLVVGSALFLRALGEANDIAPGFDPDNVYSVAFNLNLAGYEPDDGQRLLRDLRAGVEALNGVEAASFSALLPVGLPARMGFGGLTVEGVEPPPDAQSWSAYVNVVSPGYFETLAMPLLAGGDFLDTDVEGSEAVAIVNQHAADKFWPAGNAVGQQFDLGGTLYTVRGVAGDAKYAALIEELPYFIYIPVAQAYRPLTSLLLRTEVAAASVLPAVREISHRLAPDLPVLDVVGLRDYVQIGFLPQRFAANVAGVLGIVASLLAAVGMYGVTAHAAASRVREIGVRMALGAGRREVVQMVVGQGLRAPIAGLVLGLVVAVAVTRLLGSLLFGVSPLDPLAYAAGIAVLLLAALVANWLPARQASRLDPVRALRSE